MMYYDCIVFKVLLASCFVPVYAGVKPVEFQGQVIESYTTNCLGSSTVCDSAES